MLLALTSARLGTAVLALLVYPQQLEGHLIQPLSQQEAVEIPPAVPVLPLLAFGTLFGVLGPLVATPLVAVGTVLVASRETARGVSNLSSNG